MPETMDELATQLQAIKERAERDTPFREALLADSAKFLKEQGVVMDNIANVSAEYHPDYGTCILLSFKFSPSVSPAPLPSSDDKNKQGYDFLECHNF